MPGRGVPSRSHCGMHDRWPPFLGHNGSSCAFKRTFGVLAFQHQQQRGGAVRPHSLIGATVPRARLVAVQDDCVPAAVLGLIERRIRAL